MASIRLPPTPTCSASSSGGHMTGGDLLHHFSGVLPPIHNPHLSLHLTQLSIILIRRWALVSWTRGTAIGTCCAAELVTNEATWMANGAAATPLWCIGSGRWQSSAHERPEATDLLEAGGGYSLSDWLGLTTGTAREQAPQATGRYPATRSEGWLIPCLLRLWIGT